MKGATTAYDYSGWEIMTSLRESRLPGGAEEVLSERVSRKFGDKWMEGRGYTMD